MTPPKRHRATASAPWSVVSRLVAVGAGVQEFVEPREGARMVESAGALFAMIARALGGGEVDVGLFARHRVAVLTR